VVGDKLPQQLLIIAFADVETTECPEMVEMKACETASIAKLAISKHLREQAADHCIQL